MNAIYILWLRQLKRYLRSRSRVAASLGQPLLYLLALGYGLSPVFQKAGMGNYIQFIAPGVIGMTVMFTSVFSGIELIWDRQFGFLKETLVAPVPRTIIMAGRTLGGATTAILQGIVVILICLAVGFRPTSPATLLIALVYMILIALLFTAFGTAVASLLSDFQGFQLVMNFLVIPMYFLSSAIFPLYGVPRALKILATIDPLTYGIDGLRGAMTGSHFFHPATDLAVLTGCAVLLLLIGSWLFSRIQL